MKQTRWWVLWPRGVKYINHFGLQIGFQSPQTYLFSQGLLRDVLSSFINTMDLEPLTGLL